MFIEITVTGSLTWHGYDDNNREIVVADPPMEAPSRKLVPVGRIQSVSDKYVLVSSGFGRLAYWEYADGYESLKLALASSGVR